jgi:hypothetical protein
MNFSRFTQLLLVFAVLSAAIATAQEGGQILITRPRPYFFSGLDLDGNGSKVLNYAIASGVQQETNRFSVDAYGQYGALQ